MQPKHLVHCAWTYVSKELESSTLSSKHPRGDWSRIQSNPNAKTRSIWSKLHFQLTKYDDCFHVAVMSKSRHDDTVSLVWSWQTTDSNIAVSDCLNLEDAALVSQCVELGVEGFEELEYLMWLSLTTPCCETCRHSCPWKTQYVVRYQDIMMLQSLTV